MWIQTDCCVQLPLPRYIYIYICVCVCVELCICGSTVIDRVFVHRKAKATRNSEVFEVDVAENPTMYRTLQCFYAVSEKPLQKAMFLSLPRPKAPLLTGFLNLLSKSTAICDVFNDYLRGFSHFRAKTSSLGNAQQHCKSQCFCPTKTAKTITQTAPKPQNLPPRPPDASRQDT